MRLFITSRLTWIYAVCKGVCMDDMVTIKSVLVCMDDMVTIKSVLVCMDDMVTIKSVLVCMDDMVTIKNTITGMKIPPKNRSHFFSGTEL